MIRRETVVLEKLSNDDFCAFYRALERLCAEHRILLTCSHSGLAIEAELSAEPGCPSLVNGD